MAVEELGYSPKKQGAVPFKWDLVSPSNIMSMTNNHYYCHLFGFEKTSSLGPPSPPTLLSPSTSFINRRSSSPSPRSLSPPHLQQQQTQLIIKTQTSTSSTGLIIPSIRATRQLLEIRQLDPDPTVIVSTGCLIGSWFTRKNKVVNVKDADVVKLIVISPTRK